GDGTAREHPSTRRSGNPPSKIACRPPPLEDGLHESREKATICRLQPSTADMEVPMKTAIIIPARYASSRLPGKPLLRQTGKYLVQHVYERARQARRASRVIVATDDSRIAAAVRSFGGEAAMTRRTHASGTERVAEVACALDAEV